MKVPKKFKHLPVYSWCDDHDEVEWVSIGPDGGLWHCICGKSHLIQEAIDMDVKRTSKFMSLVLRHEPEKIGLTLDEAGWVDVDLFLEAMNSHNHYLTREQLQEVVDNNDKKRFTIDGNRIRANQGHSIEVDLQLEEKKPPETLYHGTIDRFLQSIYHHGLKKMDRHHVHLSEDVATASKVGSRRGKPVILKIDAYAMHRDGHKFYQSANGVWLTDNVPPEYLTE